VPVPLSSHFEVPDFDGDVGFSADAHSFVEGSHDGVAFAAHVSSVDATQLGSFTCQCDDFFHLRVRGRRVLERSGDTDGAIPHGVAHQRFHLVKLSGVGLYVRIA
jgi:hypothetical protein